MVDDKTSLRARAISDRAVEFFKDTETRAARGAGDWKDLDIDALLVVVANMIFAGGTRTLDLDIDEPELRCAKTDEIVEHVMEGLAAQRMGRSSLEAWKQEEMKFPMAVVR